MSQAEATLSESIRAQLSPRDLRMSLDAIEEGRKRSAEGYTQIWEDAIGHLAQAQIELATKRPLEIEGATIRVVGKGIGEGWQNAGVEMTKQTSGDGRSSTGILVYRFADNSLRSSIWTYDENPPEGEVDRVIQSLAVEPAKVGDDWTLIPLSGSVLGEHTVEWRRFKGYPRDHFVRNRSDSLALNGNYLGKYTLSAKFHQDSQRRDYSDALDPNSGFWDSKEAVELTEVFGVGPELLARFKNTDLWKLVGDMWIAPEPPAISTS